MALTNDRLKKHLDMLMNVVADFKEFEADLNNKKFQLGHLNAKRPLLSNLWQ